MKKTPKFLVATNPMLDPNKIYIVHARDPFALVEPVNDKLEVLWSEGTIEDGLLKRMRDWYISLQASKKPKQYQTAVEETSFVIVDDENTYNTTTDKELSEKIVNFLKEHRALSLNLIEKELELPQSTLSKAINQDDRYIPKKYTEKVSEFLKQYGLKI